MIKKKQVEKIFKKFFKKKKIIKKKLVIARVIVITIFLKNFLKKCAPILLSKIYDKHYIDKVTTIAQAGRQITINKIIFNQKLHNTKINIIKSYKNVIMFSVGSVIKYFNIVGGKSARRSINGLRVFLNFAKNLLEKLFKKNDLFILSLVGFSHQYLILKKQLKFLFNKSNNLKIFFLLNMRISFNKKKLKRIKSIKKRLKKKIVLNWVKHTKFVSKFNS